MRLTAIHIDGFGIFHHLDIVRLSPGLNVFFGDNESGKTSLLAFLRTILFGLPQMKYSTVGWQPMPGCLVPWNAWYFRTTNGDFRASASQ